MTLQAVFGIIAGLLAFTAIPIYAIDIFRGNTKPSKVTWWVLGLLNIIITLSYFVSGARDTIWIPLAYAVGFSFIAILSLFYGEGTWERNDVICVIGACLSLGVWWIFQSAAVALYLLIVIDFIGLFPTIRKAILRPWTESKFSWGVAALASVFNIFALTTWNPQLSLYPLYVLVTNVAIYAFIAFPLYKKST